MLMAFDPGYTTGVCVARGVRYPFREFTVTQSLELKWEDRFNISWALRAARLQEDQGGEQLDAIIIEDFRLNPNLASEQSYSNFPSCQVIGAIGAFAFMYGFLDRIVMQPPSNRKSVQILPVHAPQLLKGSEHAADAYRHLRYFVVMNKYGPKSKPKT